MTRSFVFTTPEPPGAFYVIVGVERCPDTGERLYWSNRDGWVDRASATRFPREHLVAAALPIGSLRAEPA
jgi:hypothetical protein